MKIFGVDYNKSMINISKKAIPNGKFICCEANQISFGENKFDAVIIFSSLQYFPDTKYFKDVLYKIKKVLKKQFFFILEKLLKKINRLSLIIIVKINYQRKNTKKSIKEKKF